MQSIGTEGGFDDSRRAPAVRPRVFEREGPHELPVVLADALLPVVDSVERGLVWLSGGPGSGKTSALRALAGEELPREPVLLDEPGEEALVRARKGVVVYAASEPFELEHLAELELAPWSDDDRIEYLLARHPAACRSVVERIAGEPFRPRLAGNPELWSAVLDRLARDEELDGVLPALRAILAELEGLGAGRLRRACVEALTEGGGEELDSWRRTEGSSPSIRSVARLSRHRAAQLIFACEEIASDLRGGKARSALDPNLAGDAVELLGLRIADEPEARRTLERNLPRAEGLVPGICASVLHAGDPRWLAGFLTESAEQGRVVPRLVHARLPGALVAGVRADDLDLTSTDLAGSDWTGASLEEGLASFADFSGACLAGANLRELRATRADFTAADLTGARAEGAQLQSSKLERAVLRSCGLSKASLVKADLSRADLRDADLREACLWRTKLDDTDLRGARLDEAILAEMDLRGALLDGCTFAKAALAGCNLEGASLYGAVFEGARLEGALLTGSRMPGADFRGADLSETGLADVHWPSADLRDANLANASFHLGSTRGGLIPSGYPSQGTRTGFYTDDFGDQGFKAPEQIRKANLRGADLRGALIHSTDFYLVDLRDALYTDEQRAHLLRTGAILESRKVG